MSGQRMYLHLSDLSVTSLVSYVALICIVARIIYKTTIFPLFFSPFRSLPTPRGKFSILGNGHELFKQPPGANFLTWIHETPNAGMIHFTGFFNVTSRLLLTTPEALAEVLNHKAYDYEKPSETRQFLTKILGNGLIVVEGAEHKFQRKKIMPAFHAKHIKDLYPLFWSKARELTDAIATYVSSGENVLEMNAWASRATLDIIGVAGLGQDFNSLKNPNDELVKKYNYLFETTPEKLFYFTVNMVLPSWVVDKLPWKINQKTLEATGALRGMCRKLLHEKRASIKSGSDSHVDILSVLLRSDSFSDDGLIDQLLTFVAAGHETTSSALTWALYLLAVHPSAQQRLRKEVHNNISETSVSRSVDSETIETMAYLNAVCNEVLRLYPTVPGTIRQAIRDTSILDQFVPGGTRVLLSMWSINRLPSFWGDDATEFNPNRWMGEGKANSGGATSTYSHLTFLLGPRSCIGQGFARAEFKCLLAALVEKFEFRLANENENITPAGAVTIKPKNGLHLILKSARI